jgi:hypothetical protein
MEIKSFNEFFDNEDLKGQHEIDYLTGNLLKGIGKNIDKMDNDNISKFISRMATINFPFFEVFLKASSGVYGDNRLVLPDGVQVFITSDGEYYNLIAESKDKVKYLIFSINIKGMNNYDVDITVIDNSNNENEGYGNYENLTFDDVKELIIDVYLPSIDNLEFFELSKFNFDKLATIIN